MKQTLFLLLLALGMLSINVNAQTKKAVRKTTKQSNVKSELSNVSKELKADECGFEWYKVGKNGKWGAEDKNGKVLVPIEYGRIEYQCSSGTGFGFRVSNNNGYDGYYSSEGECIIPCSRHYYIINADRNSSVGTYYWGWTKKDGPLFFCNESGEEVCRIEGYSLAEPQYKNGKFFWEICLK